MMEILKGIGRLFYIIDPRETSFETIDQVPDFITQAIPYFLSFIALEYIIQIIKNKPRTRLNDGITSLSHGIYLSCGQMLVRGIETYVYIKIYNNWKIYDLPWDSPITWYIAAILTDFAYYWLHRAGHEVNFIWAQHQVHHSSEDYNLTTALRQSGLQGWFVWIFYLPMAFFVPPPIFLIHQQLSILFQFWIHTECIESLGPLEFILNTPKHHRIHHGSNRYCLDKNYAGGLIIWDRMFGTFQEEKPGEKIVYGLVEEFKSFNPTYSQFFYFPKIWSRMKEYTSWDEKLSTFFKGPGWTPGKPRLGDPNDVPEVPDRKKFDIQIPLWQNIYVFVHFGITLLGFNYVAENVKVLSQTTATIYVFVILYSLTSIGLVLENRVAGMLTEIVRNAVGFMIVCKLNSSTIISQALGSLFAISALLWLTIFCWNRFLKKFNDKKLS